MDKNISIFKFVAASKGSEIPNLALKVNELEDEHRPLVVAIGWMGSKPFFLKKYTDKWIERGYNVFSYCPSTKESSLPYYRPSKIKNKMLPSIQNYLKENPKCQGIIFHIFSNGGGFYYSELIREIIDNPKFQDIHENIRGSVFDSLPTISLKANLHAVRVNAGPVVKMIFKSTLVPIMTRKYPTYWEDYTYNLNHPKNQWPHLIIYSKDDKIVTFDQVEYIINELKKDKPNLILETCFEKSPHVCHLRTHPKEYLESLDGFIQKVIEVSN